MPANELPVGDAVVLSDQELHLAIEHCQKMADAAGPVILEYFRQPMVVENKAVKGEFDPVTLADKAAERAIREVIAELRPADGILGEEGGYESGQSGLTWIIDPIDGTRAFISGLPVWGTLIALFNGERSVMGLMDQPYLRERYMGSRLGASYLQGNQPLRKLVVKPRAVLDSAILASTAPEVFSDTEHARFRALAARVATVRYGTDCYGYAMLAAGHVDLVMEAALQAYDIQPLIPIIEAAGGVVCNWQGEPVVGGGRVLAAASQELADAALAEIQN